MRLRKQTLSQTPPRPDKQVRWLNRIAPPNEQGTENPGAQHEAQPGGQPVAQPRAHPDSHFDVRPEAQPEPEEQPDKQAAENLSPPDKALPYRSLGWRWCLGACFCRAV